MIYCDMKLFLVTENNTSWKNIILCWIIFLFCFKKLFHLVENYFFWQKFISCERNQWRSASRAHVDKKNLKPIKVMITCKILGPYLKNSARYWDLKNLSFWDFVLPWLTEIVVTRLIFEIQGSYFGFIPLFTCSINHV